MDKVIISGIAFDTLNKSHELLKSLYENSPNLTELERAKIRKHLSDEIKTQPLNLLV